MEHEDTKESVSKGARAPRKSLTKTTYTQESIKKMARMGFDPIVETIKTFHLINEEMVECRYNPDGTKKAKYNNMHFAELLKLRQKLTSDMMAYRYPKVPETLNINDKPLPGVAIMLTTADSFETVASIGTVQEEDDDIPKDLNTVDENGELIDDDNYIEDCPHIPSASILKVPGR